MMNHKKVEELKMVIDRCVLEASVAARFGLYGFKLEIDRNDLEYAACIAAERAIYAYLQNPVGDFEAYYESSVRRALKTYVIEAGTGLDAA